MNDNLSRNPATQSLLTLAPHRSLRWGILIEAAAVLAVFGVLALLRFPDQLTAPITITSVQPEMSVVAKAEGRITLLVRDKQSVRAGDLVAIIDNSANWSDVQTLDRALPQLEACVERSTLADCASISDKISRLQLGDLQSDYSAMLSALAHVTELIRDSTPERQRALIERQIQISAMEQRRLERERDLRVSQEQLEKSNVDRTISLLQDKLVSKEVLDRARVELEERRIAIEEINYRLLNIQAAASELEHSLRGLEQSSAHSRRAAIDAMAERYRTLRATLMLWKERYVCAAPSDGTVSLFKFWTSGQIAKAGDEIVSVVPESTLSRIVGRMFVTQDRSSKIRIRQPVLVELANFQAEEFGAIRAEVLSVSQVPRDNRYVIAIRFPDPVVSTFGKRIDLQQGMGGEARIILDNQTILSRVLDSTRLFWDMHKPSTQ